MAKSKKVTSDKIPANPKVAKAAAAGKDTKGAKEAKKGKDGKKKVILTRTGPLFEKRSRIFGIGEIFSVVFPAS